MKLSLKGTYDQSADTAFAIYYGKFQGIAPKASRIISLVEERVEQNTEYEHLLNELHRLYLFQRASVMSILNLEINQKAFMPASLVDYEL